MGKDSIAVVITNITPAYSQKIVTIIDYRSYLEVKYYLIILQFFTTIPAVT